MELFVALAEWQSKPAKTSYWQRTLAAVILLFPTVGSAQHTPMSWEMLDFKKPIWLAPWAVVCKTIAQPEAAALNDSENEPGCIKLRPGQVVRVIWIGTGAGEFQRYQHIRADFAGRSFEGWTLGVDLVQN